MNTAAAPSAAQDAAAPPPAARRRTRWLLGSAVLLLAAGLGGLAGVRWVLGTEGGLRWLLAQVPGVSAIGVQGSVLSGNLRVQQLRINWGPAAAAAEPAPDAPPQAELTLHDLAAEGLRWRWRPADAAPGTWLAVELQSLHARQATLRSGPQAAAQPLVLPQSLALPLRLQVAQVTLDELRIDELAPATALALQGLRALRGATLTADLDQAARDYINHPRAVQVTGKGLVLSSIYKWYRKDFGDSDADILSHLAAFAAPPLRAVLDRRPAITGYAYDWDLNARA